MAPVSVAAVMNTAGEAATVATAGDLPLRSDLDDQAGVFEVETLDKEGLDGEKNSE
jgi:hypothetical protein